MFWPKEIWGPFASDLEEFKLSKNSDRAVQALNAMIANALRCLPVHNTPALIGKPAGPVQRLSNNECKL